MRGETDQFMVTWWTALVFVWVFKIDHFCGGHPGVGFAIALAFVRAVELTSFIFAPRK